MKRMRIMTSVLLSACLLFMVACSNGSTTETAAPEGTKAAPTSSASSTPGAPVKIDYGKYCNKECQDALTLKVSPESVKGKVGVAIASLTFPYGAAIKKQTEEAAKKYFPNMELLVGDGQNDPSVQTSLVDDFISKGVKVLIINAVEKDAMVPAVERAVKAGIKVISVDRTVNTKVLTTIKANDLDLGMNAGKSLITLLNGKGNVVELQGSPSASPTIDRNKGFMDAIAGSSGIKIIASQHANYDQAQGLKVMEDMLQRFPKGQINAVYTHADMMAEGALQAIKAAGRLDEIKIISIDGMQSTFDKVAAGEIAGTAVYPVIAPMNVIAAAKALVGEPLPEFIKLDSPVITKDNVAEYNGTTY